MEENIKEKSGMPVASLVLGIISIITNLFWYMFLPTGILAIIFGVRSANRTGSKLGKAGLITGIIGISLGVFVYVSLTILILVVNNIYY